MRWKSPIIVLVGLTCVPTQVSSQILRASDIAFSAYVTGYSNAEPPENCPNGRGASIGVEARSASTLFVGVAGQIHVAGPGSCGGVAIQAPHGDGYADVVGDMHLGIAPSATLLVGVQRLMGAPDLTVAAAGRMISASWDDRDGGRVTVPWIGGVVTADGFGLFGVSLELGALRAPIAWIAVQEDVWQVVERSHAWKPLWQVGFRFRPWS